MKLKYSLLFLFCSLLAASCNEDATEGTATSGIGDAQEAEIILYNRRVKTLQTATKGRGVDIVLVGDGFTLDDIKEGRYDQVMETSCGYLFTEPPMDKLRDYFNVYAVTAVSTDNVLDGSTALGCVPSDIANGTDQVYNLNVKAAYYASAAKGTDPDRLFVGVILNSEVYGGITSYNSWTTTAYAYTTLYGGLESYNYRHTLVHELVGHGIGKLADEYAYTTSDYAYVSNSAYRLLETGIYDIGEWYGNLSIYDEMCYSPWYEFENDPRYASEHIGMYAGGFGYRDGVWRPTETSLMRETEVPEMDFNAPSRYAIYRWVIYLATGEWPTYEEFVAFDL